MLGCPVITQAGSSITTYYYVLAVLTVAYVCFFSSTWLRKYLLTYTVQVDKPTHCPPPTSPENGT